jgi:malate dehydrogenase
LPKNRIIGMGGALDSSRFRTYLSLAKQANDISAMVIGGHGDTTMIPLTSILYGIPVSQFLSEEELKKVAADTWLVEQHLQVSWDISLYAQFSCFLGR